MLSLALIPGLLLSIAAATTNIPIARHYRAFGPLPYTSSSRGSNPLNSLRPSTFLQTLLSLNSFPSESAVGGHATWRDVPYNASASGVISAPFPDADTHLPYEAFAVANFTIHTDANRPYILQCSNPATISLISPQPGYEQAVGADPANTVTECPDDVYEDGRALCVARLWPGTYHILVHLFAERNVTQFYCNYFEDPARLSANLLLRINDTVLPSIVVKRTGTGTTASLAGRHCSVTLMNTHHRYWAKSGTAELLHAPTGLILAAQSQSDAHYPLPRIAPRQTRQLRIDLLTDDTFLQSVAVNDYSSPVNVTVVVTYEIGQGVVHHASFDLSFDVAIWRQSRSYHFTYVDVDGSVQVAAVLPPRNECTGAPSGGDVCSVLLSTHGAGVDAIARAWTESYQTQNQSWVLLPTGRRKYGLNWEGPQMKSAITALVRLAEELPGVPPDEKDLWKARKDYWLQAGHSMGGHGALLLSTHFPDMLVAALPAMGWLRLSTYSEAQYEAELPYSDAAARALFTVASAEYSADLYAENLLGIPFLARVGSEDTNVPPSNLRKFYRLLKENEFYTNASQSVVALSEVPEEGHWFDGVVDDNALQPFIARHLAAAVKPKLPKSFSMVTMNPASSGSRGGLAILQLVVPFQLGRITVDRDSPQPGTWTVITENVRRLRFKPVFGLTEYPEQFIIDDSAEPIPVPNRLQGLHSDSDRLDLCSHPVAETPRNAKLDSSLLGWKVCPDSGHWGKTTSHERGQDNSGPAAQVLSDRKLIVVFPEGDVELQNMAVAYSNSLYLRGISSQVTTDSNVSVGQISSSGESNMVLLGGPNVNRMAKRLFAEGYIADVRFIDSTFCVGASRCFTEPGSGLAFLSPGPKRTLIFSVAGTDRDGMLAAMPFLPRSPASNVPEWVIVSKQRGWGFRGLGGVIGLGYWNHVWKLESRKSYPPDFGNELRSGTVCAAKKNFSTSLLFETTLALFILATILLFIYRRTKRAKPRYAPVSSIDDGETHLGKREADDRNVEKDELLENNGAAT